MRRISRAGLSNFLLHGGYSSVLARGSEATLQAAVPAGTTAGWTVGVRHPLRPERRLAEFWRLRGRAISTSGSVAQAFWHQGRRDEHLVARSGRPADALLSATAVAPIRRAGGGPVPRPSSSWGRCRQYSSAASGPMTKKAVERASASTALWATAVADSSASAGRPERGSENVPVAPPLVPEGLGHGAGGRDGPPAEPQLGQAPLGPQRMADAHGPAGRRARRRGRLERGLRAAGQHAAVAAVEQEVVQARARQILRTAVEGISLAQAAEVEPHARPQEADRPPRRVEFHVLAADAGQGRGQRLLRRDRARRGGRSPTPPTAARR